MEAPRDMEIDEIRKKKMMEMMKMAIGATVPEKVIHINSLGEFESIVEEYADKLIIIDFWAEWCGPCRSFGPAFEQAKTNYPDVVFAKLNVDSGAQMVAQQFGVTGIPTILYLHNKKLVHRQVGAGSKAQFMNQVNEILKKIEA